MVDVRTSTVEVPRSAAAMPGRAASLPDMPTSKGCEVASAVPEASTITTLPPIRRAQCTTRAGRSRSARPAARDSAAYAETDSASSFAALTTRSRSPREYTKPSGISRQSSTSAARLR